MVKRVLIAIDGSELAGLVVPHLLRFITPEQTELLLVTVLPSPIFTTPKQASKSQITQQAAQRHQNKACEQLHTITEQLDKIGFKVKHQILSGAPADSIVQLAQETTTDLIAMSTHGRTGLGRALLGSVADKVVCCSSAPIFLVPSKVAINDSSSPRCILLPLDGTALAETAISTACQIAKETEASMLLVRVVDSHDSSDKSKVAPTSAELPGVDSSGENPIIRQADCYLQRIKLRLQLAGVTAHYQVLEGQPAQAITQIAHEENADLIVMSTHGRAGVERQIYGSVVSEVIGKATWPMLIMCGRVPVKTNKPSVNMVPTTS